MIKVNKWKSVYHAYMNQNKGGVVIDTRKCRLQNRGNTRVKMGDYDKRGNSTRSHNNPKCV